MLYQIWGIVDFCSLFIFILFLIIIFSYYWNCVFLQFLAKTEKNRKNQPNQRKPNRSNPLSNVQFRFDFFQAEMFGSVCKNVKNQTKPDWTDYND